MARIQYSTLWGNTPEALSVINNLGMHQYYTVPIYLYTMNTDVLIVVKPVYSQTTQVVSQLYLIKA